MTSFEISGLHIDLFKQSIYPATISIKDSIVHSITQTENASDHYILPGFVDAHIHIESSMLPPSSFARIAVTHGTIATVSDPHEIANVCGVEGVRFMIENSRLSPLKVFFGAPSCVPATSFETAGAIINSGAVGRLLQDNDIWYLSEVMNYPGVINKDPEVLAKIAGAKKAGKPIDGHAPGLRGEIAMQYAEVGISTDHESFELQEALDKIKYGIYCLIREGSAAKNFDALVDLLRTHPYSVMFCCDDKHPDELVLHHINDHVKRALAKGYDIFVVLRAASVHPVAHYGLPVGLLREGDPADFIVVDNLKEFNIRQTYINGRLVAESGKSLLPHINIEPINKFNASPTVPSDFELKAIGKSPSIRVIETVEGQLVTNEIFATAKLVGGNVVSDVDNDVLKIVVLNRYSPGIAPAIAFIKNFKLQKGAIASTIAHDCHNIIAVGVDDASISAAINALITAKGGISVAENAVEVHCLPLAIAGLMSTDDAFVVAEAYSDIDKRAKALGSDLRSPFMTLSFMALLVIPSLKLSDCGLFNGKDFRFAGVQQ
jgi:adenine deaminase